MNTIKYIFSHNSNTNTLSLRLVYRMTMTVAQSFRANKAANIHRYEENVRFNFPRNFS